MSGKPILKLLGLSYEECDVIHSFHSENYFFFRDIASAIRELLDSVNQVLKTYQDQGRIKEYRKVSVV